MSSSSAASSFPAPVYSEHVLKHVFADAQRLFLSSLLKIDRAHLVMLRQQQIISHEAASACVRALDSLDTESLRHSAYDGSVEDLFFLVERKISEIAGADHAGRLHTARSRNDIDMTMYRMVWREELLRFLHNALELRATLLGIAREHRASLMPAYTHNQPAQPTTLGHYMMAMVEVLERDAERAIACYGRLNRNPLGACAITTTGFPIDRHQTELLLGFRGLVTNSYGAIAAVDYLAETCAVLVTAMLNVGRFTQDLLLWSTAEFGFLRLSDGYVQVSSIMPQKRNPVPLEHTRIIASRALNEAQSVIGSLHNTPFADMNDSEDSLQPLVALAFTDAQRALALLNGLLSEATFHTKRMRARTFGSFLTVTEVADTMVRSAGISFHTAHHIVASAVRQAQSDDLEELAQELHRISQNEGVSINLQSIRTALDPENFVAARSVPGGPALSALNPEIEHSEERLQTNLLWLQAERGHLDAANDALHRESQNLG